MTIRLDELPTSSEPRRDRWGRYLILPMGDTAPLGYTRVTTVAKTLDSMGALGPWKATMTATGMIIRRGLRARWEALLAQHGDPWYDGEESKAACRELVEECAAVGGGNDRKELGSVLHTLTALVDVGRVPTRLTQETADDLDAYQRGLAHAGIKVLPGMVERVVVLDQYQVAGTFDRLVSVPGFDLPLVADLKTGANLEYSWQTIAVQLAAYSRANDIYEQGPKADGSDDKRLMMPKVDQGHGLIFWLPAGEARLELWTVDLDAGWEAFEHSMWVRGWNKRHPEERLTIVAPADDNLTELLEQSIAQVEARKRGFEHIADVARQHEAPPTVSDHDTAGLIDAYRAWLQLRIDVIGEHSEARKDLGASWPDDTPTLRASADHSTEQLDLIEAMLVAIEARYGIDFPPPDPRLAQQEQEAAARVLDLFPGATPETTSN